MANKVSDSVAVPGKQSRNERIEEFLREHYAFRYNTVKSRAEFRSSDGEFLPVTKYRLNSFRRELDRTIGISTSAENLRSMLESDFSERVNPVQAYFHKLPLVTGTQAIDITDPADTYYRDQIPYIPWHSGSAILALFYKGWGLNYSFIYTGQRYNQQENIPRNNTQPWYTSDLSLQKTFKIRTRTLKATAEVNNLFGQDYDVVLNYPMPKTNFRFVVSVDL